MVTGLCASRQVCIDNNLLRHNAFWRTRLAKEQARLKELKGRFYYLLPYVSLLRKKKQKREIQPTDYTQHLVFHPCYIYKHDFNFIGQSIQMEIKGAADFLVQPSLYWGY